MVDLAGAAWERSVIDSAVRISIKQAANLLMTPPRAAARLGSEPESSAEVRPEGSELQKTLRASTGDPEATFDLSLPCLHTSADL